MLKTIFPLAALTVVLSLLTAASAVAQVNGVVKVTQVTVPAFLVSADGSEQPLLEGSLVPIGSSVRTGLGGSAMLLFSNGASLTIEPNTGIKLVSYQTGDTLPADAPDFGEHTEEPTSSTTLLQMEEGRVIGEVPDLRQGSSWEIETPSGTAGVRGTTIVSERRVDATTGAVSYDIAFYNGAGYVQLPNGQIVSVPANQQITVDADSNYTIEEAEDIDLYAEETPAAGEPDGAPEPTEPEVEVPFITPQFGDDE